MSDGFCSNVKTVLKKLCKALKSLTGLVIILIIFNVVGAIIFVELEAKNERNQAEITRLEIETKHGDLVQVLENVKYALNDSKFEALRNDTISMIRKYEDEMNYTEPAKKWDIWNAMFFCGTIYTTIGYGNIYPQTDAGKIAAILYSVVGIPLAMRILAEIGTKLTKVLKFVYFSIKRRCSNSKNNNSRYTLEDKEKDYVVSVELNDKETDGIKVQEQQTPEENGDDQTCQKKELPVVVPIIILIVYIFLGGVMYTFWESWGYLDAFYFVFISISTIGFGDITPQHTKYFIVTSLYVFIGLALVSMCINVLIEFYIMSLKVAVDQVDKVTSHVKKGCGCGGRRQSI